MRHARARTRWAASALAVVVALVVGGALAPGPSHLPASGAPPGPSYPATWVRFAPADGWFHVMAPGTGAERVERTDAGVLHRTDVTAPDDGAWFVQWLDVAPEVASGRSAADLVDLVAAPMPDLLGARLDEEDILRDGPFPGVELRLSASGGSGYLIRVLATGARLVEAAAELTPTSSRIDAERFVRSLELDLA